jgi:hypothetical protein
VGDVTIQPALDVVLFRAGDCSSFYHVKDVDYVTYHDTEANLGRKFVALKFSHKGLLIPQLFEVVVSGKLSVVRKPASTYVPAVDDVRAFDYFIVKEGNVVEITEFRKKIFPLIAASCSRACLKVFMREKQIDPGRNDDALRLIEYYNNGSIAHASVKHSARDLY